MSEKFQKIRREINQGLRREIMEELQARPGEYSLYYRGLGRKESLLIAADRVYPAASLIKIPVMIEVFRQAEAGRLELDSLRRVPAAAKVAGSYVIQELRPDIELSVRELTVLMIILSDNTAANLLIDLVGMENINSTLRTLGLRDTVLKRKMMDFAARKEGRENFTTAREMGMLLEQLYRQKLPGLSGAAQREIFRILTRQVYRDNLSFYFPEKYWDRIGSKTGSLEGYIHDASIFSLEEAGYVLVMMSGNLPANAVGKETLARVSRIIYDFMIM